MTPQKFKKICKKYFTDPTFTMEDIESIDYNTKTISIYLWG